MTIVWRLLSWDDRLLAEHLKDLSELALDFSIELTGFEVGEIDMRIESLNCGVEGEADPADAIAEAIPENRCVTRPNDRWLLGEHRVLVRKSLERCYAALLEGKEASVVISNPPYNLKIVGNVSGLGAVRHREFAMASGEMTMQSVHALSDASVLTVRPPRQGRFAALLSLIGAISARCSPPGHGLRTSNSRTSP